MVHVYATTLVQVAEAPSTCSPASPQTINSREMLQNNSRHSDLTSKLPSSDKLYLLQFGVRNVQRFRASGARVGAPASVAHRAVPASSSRLCLHSRPASGAKRHRRGTGAFRPPAGRPTGHGSYAHTNSHLIPKDTLFGQVWVVGHEVATLWKDVVKCGEETRVWRRKVRRETDATARSRALSTSRRFVSQMPLCVVSDYG